MFFFSSSLCVGEMKFNAITIRTKLFASCFMVLIYFMILNVLGEGHINLFIFLSFLYDLN